MNPHEIPSPEIFKNRLPIQIRFSDVDVVGHVNNIVYLQYYDTGKATFMTELLGRSISWQEVDTVVANIDCAFISPIFWGEKIEVLTTCTFLHDKRDFPCRDRQNTDSESTRRCPLRLLL